MTTTKDKVRELLRRTPRPDAIDSVNKARAFKKAHADCRKQFKDGKCTDAQAQTIFINLSVFF